MSIVTYQYRVKDSTSHKHLARMASAVNFVWNYCNEVSMLAQRRDKCWLTGYDLHALVAGTSKALGLHSQSIQQVCTEYVTRRRQFGKRRLKWRSKKRSLGWIPFPGQAIRIQGDEIAFSGHIFRFWLSRPTGGTIKAGSFTEDARGRWYVNLQCEVDDPGTPMGSAEIGIDLGLKQQIACSDGTVYSRDNLTRKYEDQLGMAQRAGKKKRAAALHARIKNVRKDWAHKVTTEIVRRARVVVVGDVSSSGLAGTRMAKSIYDAGWHQLRRMLAYKANRLGVHYREVNESGSSVRCSACLERTGPSGLRALGVRVWCCRQCGSCHDRDTNAAINILRLGRQTPVGGIPVL